MIMNCMHHVSIVNFVVLIKRGWMRNDTAEIVACGAFGTGVWLVSVAFRRYSLQILYSYHGWMYESHGKATLKSKIWTVCVVKFNFKIVIT